MTSVVFTIQKDESIIVAEIIINSGEHLKNYHSNKKVSRNKQVQLTKLRVPY
jgi:hypothetical protein